MGSNKAQKCCLLPFELYFFRKRSFIIHITKCSNFITEFYTIFICTVVLIYFCTSMTHCCPIIIVINYHLHVAFCSKPSVYCIVYSPKAYSILQYCTACCSFPGRRGNILQRISSAFFYLINYLLLYLKTKKNHLPAQNI